jgi:uncharacterized membrane protein YhaH (DUF805 family)
VDARTAAPSTATPSTATPSITASAWLAAFAAGPPLAAIATFWSFMWLIGSNGYYNGRGEMLLYGNAALALACLVAGVVAAALLARRFRRNGRGPWFAVLAGAGLGTCAGAVALVVIGLVFSIVAA